MSANVEAMVRAGVEAYRAGNKPEARTLLERAIELDQNHAQAWLWLSAVVDNAEEQQICLENVLVIDPTNERAQQGLRSLGIDPASVTGDDSGGAAAVDTDTSAPAFTAESMDDFNVPSSSASVQPQGDGLSSDDYDEWMDGLNLGTEPPTEAASSSDIFGDADFSADDSAFDLDSDAGYDENFDYAAVAEDDLFAEDALLADDSVSTGDTASAADLDLFDDDVGDLLGHDAASDEEDLLDDDLLGEAGGYYDDDDYDDDYEEEGELPDLSQFFAQIPAEIEATRLPGVSEGGSSSGLAITGVLGLLNVFALIFLVLQLVG